MSVSVVRQFMKHSYLGEIAERFYLKQEAGTSRLYTGRDLANNIQEISALSASDVTHTTDILMTELRKVLVRGDRVKIDGLGTFYMTLSCEGTESEDELTVRHIKRVNIRFLPDKALKLVNNSLATTRSDNNVSFAIKGDAAANSGNNPGGTGGDGDDDEYIDPNA